MNSPTSITVPRATLADLASVVGKAEVIGGRVVTVAPTGYRPGIIAQRIIRRLGDHVDHLGRGAAFGDNVGFVVADLSTGRESFSPDASYYSGAPPVNEMRFVPGVPDFTAEEQSEEDYGPAAGLELAAKRAESISRLAHSSSGTSIPRRGSCGVIAPMQRPRCCSVREPRPTPNRRCRVGGCPWTGS